MRKSLSHMEDGWEKLLNYRKDGRYAMDTYHSIVSTCKQQGYSILEYLKKFFEEIAVGNHDYGKLMPSTIGISTNEL